MNQLLKRQLAESKYLVRALVLITLISANNQLLRAQVRLEQEVKINDRALYFDGDKVGKDTPNSGSEYDYFFGRKISAHGDCIKKYKEYVFMTWYRGGKYNRHVMLTRYNTVTGTRATIEFPHTHTGYLNKWWIGESHNTIAIGVSPKDGSIHLLYDMHAYSETKPTDGSLSDDYFRYSFSKKNAATVSDANFTLSQFVKDPTDNDYKHLTLKGDGSEDYNAFSGLTYPQFFLNDSGDLFMFIREGGNNNGAYKFTKYSASSSSWSSFTQFNVLDAKQQGQPYNWGLYGNLKYVDGKIRIGFQQRSSNNNDKYQYQNGFYYAYSDNQNGLNGWKSHKNQSFSLPLLDPDKIKVSEPGDLVATNAANMVRIVDGFDWTVTDRGDVHLIGKVKDQENNTTTNVHTYRKAGTGTDFTTTTNFAGADKIYTAGNDIYIIGLTSDGRVYIEKGIGGTNNFTRVYEQVDGTRFRHGKVYISDGKLYYFLMSIGSGSAQPIYLQTIDLDIQPQTTASVTAPSNNSTFTLGQTITLKANASTSNGSISKVNFKINNAYFKQDVSSPYETTWTPTSAGMYAINVAVYDNDNVKTESDPITVVIQAPPTDMSGTYTLKNVASNQYMDSDNNSIIRTNSSNSGSDKQWILVNTEGEYYNIDSKASGRGILRAKPDGEVIYTSFTSPDLTNDKEWKAIPLGNNTYRFESRVSGRDFLSVNTSTGLVEWSSSTGNNTKWQLESVSNSRLASGALFKGKNENEQPSLIVYPNPAKHSFNISLQRMDMAHVSIFNMAGKLVFKKSTSDKEIRLSKGGGLTSGIYLIQVIDHNQQLHSKKFVIE